ncbi:MAG: DUF3784 domain-containing protein [Lachnospiraceae bacterium]|nr:DUF3784 domain-containing protein [Lachnospiraceae bacterium]
MKLGHGSGFISGYDAASREEKKNQSLEAF